MGVYLCWYAGRLLPQGILQVTCPYRLAGSSGDRVFPQGAAKVSCSIHSLLQHLWDLPMPQMIIAQRGCEANLKALQTDGDMLKATLELLA